MELVGWCYNPITNSQQDSKTHPFGFISVCHVQGIGEWAFVTAICYKCSSPSPLPGQIVQPTLLQVCH